MTESKPQHYAIQWMLLIRFDENELNTTRNKNKIHALNLPIELIH